jgi:hypothetical protein
MVSCDLGQSFDPTAIAILEATTRGIAHARYWNYDDENRPADVLVPPRAWYTNSGGVAYPNAIARLQVRYLERLPLQMPYPDQVAAIARLIRRPPFDVIRPQLLVDQTGVGRAVVDIFRRSGLRPVGVTITAGDNETREGEDWRVSKIRIVSRLQALLNTGELWIAPDLREARTLASELQDFRGIFTDTGYARFGAREGAHDDLVLAVAIGAWWAAREIPTMTTFTLQY